MSAAWTALGGAYPSYLNFTVDGEEVVVHLREPGVLVPHGVFVCMTKPGPGNCTPGGPTCNNYCNMAPEKGPMQDHPLPNPYTKQGQYASIRVPLAEFQRMIGEFNAQG